MMDRRSFLWSVPAAAVSIGALPRLVFAQDSGDRAGIVAARVQAFYDQTHTVQARFIQRFWHRVQQRTQTSRGQVAIERPGKIRFDYDQPSGKILVSDGTTWTMFEPDEEGPGQYARGSAAAASTGALGFLMGTTSLTEFRRSLRAPSRNQPAHTDALELRPLRPDPRYARLVIYVDDRPQSLGVVRRVSIEDPDGNWNTFDFRGLRFNRDLDESVFRYRPPADAREMRAPSSAG